MQDADIIRAVSSYQPVLLKETTKQAAVMVIVLTKSGNTPEIVLTKRAETLQTYAGDYSFPGGMRSIEDTDLYATAVREVQEELNLPPDSYQFLGQLDDFNDRFGRLVRPFVIMMSKGTFMDTHAVAHDEISAMYYFSLAQLDAIQDNPELHAITRRQPSYSFREGDVFIWGLTAAILVHLSNVLTRNNRPLGKTITFNNDK